MRSNLSDTALWAWLDRASSFAIVNLLWVVCSLPIITLPIATAGLVAVHTDWVREKDREALGRFFAVMRQMIVKATLIGLGTGVGLLLVGINLLVLPQMGLPSGIIIFSVGITVGVAWVILATNLYLWPLLSIYEDAALIPLITVAAQLAFSHVVWSSGVLLLALGLFLVGLWALPMGGIVLILFSSVAWTASWGAWRIIQHYPMENLMNE